MFYGFACNFFEMNAGKNIDNLRFMNQMTDKYDQNGSFLQ